METLTSHSGLYKSLQISIQMLVSCLYSIKKNIQQLYGRWCVYVLQQREVQLAYGREHHMSVHTAHIPMSCIRTSLTLCARLLVTMPVTGDQFTSAIYTD